MKCCCCERKQQSDTHVITLTPRRGSAGIHPQAVAPRCPLGLKHHWPPQPLQTPKSLSPHSLFLSLNPHQSIACDIFKSSTRLLSTKTRSQTINRGPRWSCQSCWNSQLPQESSSVPGTVPRRSHHSPLKSHYKQLMGLCPSFEGDTLAKHFVHD